MIERVSPIPRLAATRSNVIRKAARGGRLFNILTLKHSVSDEMRQPHWRDKKERGEGGELEVATITYLRVSGLEGLGSPIISGVGSG